MFITSNLIAYKFQYRYLSIQKKYNIFCILMMTIICILYSTCTYCIQGYFFTLPHMQIFLPCLQLAQTWPRHDCVISKYMYNKRKKIVQSEIDPLTLQPKGVKIKQGRTFPCMQSKADSGPARWARAPTV